MGRINHRTKHIAYAYPTSTHAQTLGMGDTGCWFIEETWHNIEGSGQVRSGIHPQASSEGFSDPLDPDLQQLFAEVDGEVCPVSLKYHADWYTKAALEFTKAKDAGFSREVCIRRAALFA